MNKILVQYHRPLLLAFFTVLCLIIFHQVLWLLFFTFSLAVVIDPFYTKIKHKVKNENLILAILLLSITLIIIALLEIPVYYLHKYLPNALALIDQSFNNMETSPLNKILPLSTFGPTLADNFYKIFSYVSDTLLNLPRIIIFIFVFYFSLFASIKYFQHIRNNVKSILPQEWIRTIKILHAKSYMLFKSFYVIQVLIAILVFFLSLPFFWILHFKAAIYLMGFITCVFQLIPFVGAFSMLVLVALYTMFTGNITQLLLVLFLGYPLLVILPEMIIRPWLLGQYNNISMSVMLIGILAGILAMGLVGIIAGPWLLIMCLELFRLVQAEQQPTK